MNKELIRDQEKVNEIMEGKTDYKSLLKHIEENHHILGLTEKDIGLFTGYSRRERDYYHIVPRIGVTMANDIYLNALYHEYAHMIEIADEKPDRILQEFFGLSYTTKVQVYEQFYDQPITYNATKREMRTMAIQAKLMSYVFNLDEDAVVDYYEKGGLDSLRHMEDLLNIRVEEKESMRVKEVEELRLDVVRKEFKEYYKTLDLKDILRRTEIVKHIRGIEDWSLDEILDKSHYEIPVAELEDRVNVWGCWSYLDKPISKKEIKECLRRGFEELVDTESLEDENPVNKKKLRLAHVKKIAYFVKNGFDENIFIDLGFPELNAINDGHIVVDGNHRLAAAIYRGDEFIKASIHGSTDYIQESGLYYPNNYMNVFEQIIQRKGSDIGLATEILSEDEYSVFEQLKATEFKVIDADEFAEKIELKKFINEEGWHPREIVGQDPDVIFYEMVMDGRRLLGISHSGDDHLFCTYDIHKMIESKKEIVKNNQDLESDPMAWLLHPENSIYSTPKTGRESVYEEKDGVKIIKGENGFRYQIEDEGEIVAGLQVVDNTIENRYTSERHRRKGFSNKLINIVKKYHSDLQHSDIQSDMGKLASTRTGLPKRKRLSR